jgi:hypothetical protein
VIFDFFVSNPDVNNCDLDAVTVPTLIVHAVGAVLSGGSSEAAARPGQTPARAGVLTKNWRG